MTNLKLVRTLTTNFSTYQGLKGIPIGLLLLLISLWASAQTGPAPDVFFPVGISILFGYLYWIVHRFYNRVYGIVVPENKQKLIGYFRDALFGMSALAAFWVDVSIKPVFSTLGLVFASALLIDFVRIVRTTKEHLLLFYPIAALLMTALSLASVFDFNWWAPLGIKALIFAICATAGLVFTVLGVITHISLENILLSVEGASNE